MAELRTAAVSTAMDRLEGAVSDNAKVRETLGKSINIDVAEVTFNEGDRMVFPATKEAFEAVNFVRTVELGGRSMDIAGFVLDCVDDENKPTGQAKVIYYSTLRKIGIPCFKAADGSYKLKGAETVRPEGNVYTDVMKCANMGKVYDFIVANKIGDRNANREPAIMTVTKVTPVETATYITGDNNQRVISGTRQTNVPSFQW